ncbi:MAG: MFS transporter [Chlamydiales bacterium]|nr:MFS transporter [Chlamydiales bacterium]
MTKNASFYEQMKLSLSETSLKPIHWKVWLLSAMGIFLDGYDLFVISIAMPLIILDFAPSSVLQGLIGSSAVLGMVFGASIGGYLTDRYGRRAIYLIDLMLFIVFTILTAFSWDSISLILFRFLLGVGIGADYPICASYVSELMPKNIRGKMMIGAFSFQAIGIIAAAVTGLFILTLNPSAGAWRWILASGALPALIVLILRTQVFESPFWLLAHGKNEKAIKIISQLTQKSPAELQAIQQSVKSSHISGQKGIPFYHLFTKAHIRQTILSSIPWLLMDIATYAVGVFTPIILSAMLITKGSTGNVTITSIFSSVTGAAFIDLFLIIGFLLNILLIEKWGRINLQILGFSGMAAGLMILVLATLGMESAQNHVILVFSGFIIFNLLMNMGPNATTFTIPAEVFPTKIRASGHGFAAGCAKIGAFIGIFFLPILTEHWGLPYSLIALAFVSMIGMFVTLIFQIETKGTILS